MISMLTKYSQPAMCLSLMTSQILRSWADDPMGEHLSAGVDVGSDIPFSGFAAHSPMISPLSSGMHVGQRVNQ
jgi:hypothetical protein